VSERPKLNLNEKFDLYRKKEDREEKKIVSGTINSRNYFISSSDEHSLNNNKTI
jgi:hypothetical protein